MNLMKEAYEILSKYSFLPLGNSSTQNLLFLIQDDYSVGRKIRSYYMRLWDRMQALEENLLNLKESEIELKKLERQLENETDELERELIEVKIKRIENNRKYLYKLFIDCMKEIEDVVYAIKALPEITLEEFERGEIENFTKRLLSQATENPNMVGLRALGMGLNERGEVVVKEKRKHELIENRIKALEVSKNYEQVKSLFTKNDINMLGVQELPKMLPKVTEKIEEEIETSVEKPLTIEDISVKTRRREKSR